jgi:hypothetical protein
MARKSKDDAKPVAVEWRGSQVFGCPVEGCGYAHEREDRVTQHIRSGKHHVPRSKGPSEATSGPEPGADAVAAPEPGEAQEPAQEPGGEE